MEINYKKINQRIDIQDKDTFLILREVLKTMDNTYKHYFIDLEEIKIGGAYLDISFSLVNLKKEEEI